MIDMNSKNIRVNGHYGTWSILIDFKYKENVAYLLEIKEGYFKGERTIVDKNGEILIDGGRDYADFKKYIDDLEFYYGGSLRQR